MALTIQNRILNQYADSSTRYYYLYEPLPVLVEESDLTARQLTINIDLINSETGVTEKTLEEYAVYDINAGQPINLDLMKVVQQAHDADVWKFGTISDLVSGKDAVVSKYIYKLIFTSNSEVESEENVSILPILGGRNFSDFEPLVLNSFYLNEFDKYGVDISNRWKGYPIITTSLNTPLSTGEKVSVSQTINTFGKCADGGMLYWKSRLGGWMQWGFELKTERSSSNYTGNIEVGMFKTPRNFLNGNPFIPTNYSGVSYSNSVTLKSLSLSMDELRAVNSISQTPICYYLKSPNSRLELIKISNVTVPLNNQANGGDFSVSFGSISSTGFKTR